MPEFTIYSDIEAYENIKTIDPKLLDSVAPANGGLKWRRLRNYPLGKHFLWQSGLLGVGLRKEFDAIIYLGNMYHLSTWISAILARLAGKKTFFWTHGVLRDEGSVKEWIRRCFYGLATGLLLYGNRAKDILVARGFNPSALNIVYNSLDYDKQCAIRSELTPTHLKILRSRLFKYPDGPVLIFAGRLTPSKKLGLLIKAAATLHLKGFPCNILLIGDGPDLERLRRLADERGLAEHVCFYGACYGEDELGPLLSLADICISPGAIGLTCMHALVYGTPVITHDDRNDQGPEFEAIIPGVSGAFFKKDDVDSLTEKILFWLNSTSERAAVRIACQKVIDDYYNPAFQVNVINQAILAAFIQAGA